ncbi:unnamed protein product [Urochloa humidicola]
MECMVALRPRPRAGQKPGNLMMPLVHVTPMVIKGVVEEVQGSEMVLHHMEEEADLMGEAMVLLQEKISLILMENMFTGMIQICHQEKVIGYARIQIVEISILLGALTVTIATSSAIQHEKHMNVGAALQGVIPALHEGLQGWLVHLVIEPPQEKWPGTDHYLVDGVLVILGDMELDPLQNALYGLQICHLRIEWASVVSATQGTVQSLSGLPLITTVGGSVHMMVILTGVGVALGLLGLTGPMICVTEAALLHGTG